MKRKPGRRPLSDTHPLAHTSVTAMPEHLVFYLILGNGNVSNGIQQAPEALMGLPQYKQIREQANEIVGRAREIVGHEATLQDIYSYVRDNFNSLK